MKTILTDIDKIFSQISQISSDVIWTINLDDYMFKYVSEGVDKLGGVTQKEALNIGLKDVLSPASYELTMKIIKNELKKDIKKQRDKLRGLELELIRKDKSSVWISANMFFVRDKRKKPIGVIGTARDISDRLSAEDALERSNKLYSNFVEISPDAILLLDKDGIIVNANIHAANLANQKVRNIVGKNFSTILIPEDDKSNEDFLKLVQEKGRVTQYHFSFKRKGGTLLKAEVSASSIIDDDNSTNLFIVVCHDITNSIQSKNALTESQGNMTALLNATNDAALLVDKEGIILALNEIALILPIRNPRALSGKTLDEIIGTNVYDYIPKKGVKPIKEIIKEIADTGLPYRNKIQWNNRYFDFSIFPVSDEVGTVTGISIFGRDITMQKKAEHALQYKAEFEGIITNISSKFINLLPTELDEGINEAFQVIGEFEGVDRIYLYQVDESGQEMAKCTNEWGSQGVKPISKTYDTITSDRFLWAAKKVANFEHMHIKKVSDFPEEAVPEIEYFKEEGVKSMIAFPMVSKRKVIGLLGFDTINEHREWSEDAITLLKMFTVLLVNTLENKKAEKELLDIFMSRLSDREIQLLKFFAQGYTWPEDKRVLGKKMDVLAGTLDKYYARIKDKMNIEDNKKVAKVASMHFKAPDQEK